MMILYVNKGFSYNGILIYVVAYPVYSYITKKEKERVAPLILSLTEELMK